MWMGRVVPFMPGHVLLFLLSLLYSPCLLVFYSISSVQAAAAAWGGRRGEGCAARISIFVFFSLFRALQQAGSAIVKCRFWVLATSCPSGHFSFLSLLYAPCAFFFFLFYPINNEQRGGGGGGGALPDFLFCSIFPASRSQAGLRSPSHVVFWLIIHTQII